MLELRLVRCTGLESKKIHAGRSQHRIVNTILGHNLYLCSKLRQDPLEQVFTYLNSSKCSSLYCGLPQVRLQPLNGVLRAAARMIGGVPRFGHITDYMRDVLHWLPVQQRIHYRISSIVWHCVLGNAPQDYLLELFILTSTCSGRRSLRSVSKGDFLVPRARTATDRKGLSRLWVPLFGMVFPLNFVLCRGAFPVFFINSSRLSSLAEPGLGTPLSSYLEGVLYKLIYR